MPTFLILVLVLLSTRLIFVCIDIWNHHFKICSNKSVTTNYLHSLTNNEEQRKYPGSMFTWETIFLGIVIQKYLMLIVVEGRALIMISYQNAARFKKSNCLACKIVDTEFPGWRSGVWAPGSSCVDCCCCWLSCMKWVHTDYHSLLSASSGHIKPSQWLKINLNDDLICLKSLAWNFSPIALKTAEI